MFYSTREHMKFRSKSQVKHDGSVFFHVFMIFSLLDATWLDAGSDWTKIVTLRDPLERLLSGYLDWCNNTDHVNASGHQYQCANYESTTLADTQPTLEMFSEVNVHTNLC